MKNDDKVEQDTKPVNIEIIEPTAIGEMARAEIDIQIAAAHRFPRSLETFKKGALEKRFTDFKLHPDVAALNSTVQGKQAHEL